MATTDLALIQTIDGPVGALQSDWLDWLDDPLIESELKPAKNQTYLR